MGDNRVNLRLFPDKFLQYDKCFGFSNWEMVVRLTHLSPSEGTPEFFHIVHPDFDYLAKDGHLPFSFDRCTQSLSGKLSTSNPYALR
jgi:hypothetical protein